MAVALKTIYRQQDVPSPEEFQKTYIKQFGPEPIDAIYYLFLEEDDIFSYFSGHIAVIMHGKSATIINGQCKVDDYYYDFINSDGHLKEIIFKFSFYMFSWTLKKIFFRKLYFDFPCIRFNFICMSTYLREDIERSIVRTLPFILPEGRWG
ncbi:hypothetical protein [Insolitispirillum peregrinum]|uniref:hypothetical protein n=1 Tax=Insolitispirillum peregrinum TaxID=80876 RepID=UPI00362272AA